MNRRRFLRLTAASGALGLGVGTAAAGRALVVNDVSQLNPVNVADEKRPRSTDDVRAAIRRSFGHVSVGGGRFSMGGQIVATDSLHLDMRRMNQVVSFDVARRVVRVQAGMTWRDLQDVIDPHDLSIKIMQSYSNFTVGGSVSVNCHGRYVGKGPLVNSVRAVQLVTADGEVLELSRERDRELFGAVFGGYAGLGVITEIELELEANSKIERVVQSVALRSYSEFFHREIQSNQHVVLHNADLTPPNFESPRAISWIVTEKPLTEASRLIPRGLDYNLEKNAIFAITELPGGSRLREKVIEPALYEKKIVTWRNHQASLDTASLEPRTRSISTYLLQEYFIPVEAFQSFVHEMARILSNREVNVLNVSIRHSPADKLSLLSWAPTNVFSFVLYYKQRNRQQDRDAARIWTRELIDSALRFGGRYYLPYRLDATPAQFIQTYPEVAKFAAQKKRVDPKDRFRNLLWDRYLPTNRLRG